MNDSLNQQKVDSAAKERICLLDRQSPTTDRAAELKTPRTPKGNHNVTCYSDLLSSHPQLLTGYVTQAWVSHFSRFSPNLVLEFFTDYLLPRCNKSESSFLIFS